ncbi:unnamed protein product [Cladocopium goreaui]|uniref:DUF21 domain-containing protein n=1 Tax=Cladocopium goreaui TaxID=2562237 RepID=A0A9P1GFF9_9DINO|nr:unnamed protein product [Cladocopium goreaui]|mmetsp:Transcript_10873/g.23940  ORF Transcript_10873/g.23940 Transcript_10873/m.23940 type:complete len:189 (+) Transcript_10873:43-609(+)
MAFPLIAAAYFGNVHELMDCLRDGEDIEETDPKDGCRPLHAAVITEQEDAVRYLLRQNADLEAPGPDGLSPLLLACRCDAVSIVRLLLEKGADRTGAEEICERHGAKRSLGALNGEAPDPGDPPGDPGDDGATNVSASAKEPCKAPSPSGPSGSGGPWFGSAVDPTFFEEEAERDALAQMQALEEAVE